MQEAWSAKGAERMSPNRDQAGQASVGGPL